MIALQHPEKEWISFASKLPALNGAKIGLFTTYKLATGSMFRKMKKHLGENTAKVEIEIKSKTGKLGGQEKQNLELIINS